MLNVKIDLWNFYDKSLNYFSTRHPCKIKKTEHLPIDFRHTKLYNHKKHFNIRKGEIMFCQLASCPRVHSGTLPHYSFPALDRQQRYHYSQEHMFRSLRNTGLLARLEAVNARVEPQGNRLVITIPDHEPFGVPYYCEDAISHIERALNSLSPTRHAYSGQDN